MRQYFSTLTFIIKLKSHTLVSLQPYWKGLWKILSHRSNKILVHFFLYPYLYAGKRCVTYKVWQLFLKDEWRWSSKLEHGIKEITQINTWHNTQPLWEALCRTQKMYKTWSLFTLLKFYDIISKYFNSFFFFFLATQYGVWNLSSPSRDWTYTLCIGSMES